jgi:hypothetical protein
LYALAAHDNVALGAVEVLTRVVFERCAAYMAARAPILELLGPFGGSHLSRFRGE